MTGAGPTHQDTQPPVEEAAAAPTPSRAGRQTFANMLRSLVPLVVIILVIVGWTAFRQSPDVDPVKPAENLDSTVRLAAERAGYPLLVPAGLPDGYVATSARTDAGGAAGGTVSLEIGFVTPEQRFAGFAESDDPSADAVTAVLADATEEGVVQIGGQTWTRSTRLHEGDRETVLSREIDGVTVVVSGSASDQELQEVAAAVRPYSP